MSIKDKMYANNRNHRKVEGTKLEEALIHSNNSSGRRTHCYTSSIMNTDGCEVLVCPECGETYPAFQKDPVCCGKHLRRLDD